jgi:hypothetical protein
MAALRTRPIPGRTRVQARPPIRPLTLTPSPFDPAHAKEGKAAPVRAALGLSKPPKA